MNNFGTPLNIIAMPPTSSSPPVSQAPTPPYPAFLAGNCLETAGYSTSSSLDLHQKFGLGKGQTPTLLFT